MKFFPVAPAMLICHLLAQRCEALGIDLIEGRIIQDIETTIIDIVNDYRTRVDYVFTTGGIGPTHDDITSASIAKAFGVELERNAEAVEVLERHYPSGKLNEATIKDG